MLLWVVAVISTWPTQAHAGDDEDFAGGVGAAASGLPGVGRVAFAAPKQMPHAALSVGAGYGFTEAQAGEAGAHHRALGSFAIMAQPLRFLSAALMLDGRRDAHPDDARGPSSSTVGEPRLFVRGSKVVGGGLAVGAQLGLWIPGGEAPSLRLKASTLDAQLLATYAPRGRDLAISLNAGYRLDGSAKVLDDRDRPRLRPGDRLSLRLSDFNAVLLGVGGSKRLGAENTSLRSIELLGDLTWDVLVGGNAPRAIESPLRLGLGGRYHVREDDARVGAMQVEIRGELGLSARPPSGPADPLVPIDPRFGIVVGLRWAPALLVKPKTSLAPAGGTRVESTVRGAASGAMRGRVTSSSGDPIPNARVVATSSSGGPDAPPSEGASETAADGSFALKELRPGLAHVVVKAPGYDDVALDATIVDGAGGAAAPVVVDIVMKKTIRPGQLRGLVRSFNGKPIAATIRVEPLGVETKTDADGMFQIDAPPGAYEVQIAAQGYAGQRRPVQVEENGVTILNADLRPGKDAPP